ncbi:MAG: diguanylate cyclase, partial [Candidatus Cloacimonetes bacterium]|nr:diguanylate cyclase [Candidatus Cloacimonadota bacterium]
QKNLVSSTRQLFIALSHLPEVTSHNQAEVQTILSEILKSSPQYSSIFIADPSGTIWASAIPLKKTISVSDRRYFKNALASGRLSSGEYHIARTSEKPTFNLGYPLKDATGKVTSVICAGFSLDYYGHSFEAYKLQQGANFAILDHQGIVLTIAVNPGENRGKQSNPDIFKQMLEGPEVGTSVGVSSVTGDVRIQTYYKLRLEGEPTPYMYVRAGIPVGSVMSAANASFTKNIMIYTIFLTAALLLSWMISKKCIIDRVLVLEQSSQRLADGDLNTRIAHKVWGGELGKLGEAFDNMAQRLADHVHDIQHKADEYQAIIQTTSDGFTIVDVNGKIIDANGAYCRMVGYTVNELMTMNIADIEVRDTHEIIAAHVSKIIEIGSDSFISRHKHKNGTVIDVAVTITYRDDNGGKLYSFIRDITDLKKLEADLLQAATYDSLTGIFNRKTLEDKIAAEMVRSKRYGTTFSVIMFDIDDFKQINDKLGHHVGDKVLQDIAGVVKGNIRTLDAVGRWGGEEFMILLSETNYSEAAIVAEKLRTLLASHRAGEADYVTASFGMTSYHNDDALDTIFKRVDDLLYLAKNRGKNQIAF